MAKKRLFVSNTWTAGEDFPPCGICGKEIKPSWGDYIFRVLEKGKPSMQICSDCAAQLRLKESIKVVSGTSPLKTYLDIKNSMWRKPF
ncbi:MAG: hypothetical protein JW760_01505 [Spirochaetales bacterium]|nr:hypothetical protein [Spirochaetales bacterium]